VEVHLERGGQDLIRVIDNGRGISPEDLPLALAPHATSKLTTPEDLYRIGTMGFRGEALASIASVSRVRIESRLPSADSGYAIESNGGQLSEVMACGCPPGTMVEVRNLFFNTPVRRKFLKTVQTELAHCVDAFTRVALAYPELAAVLKHNDRVLYDLPGGGRLLERLALFFGRELAEHLIWVEAEFEGYRLSGYVAHPSQTRPTTKGQFFFVNRRYVRDRSLSHALAEAYRGLVMSGRQPIAFLFIEMPVEDVDVNVHPTKVEVRFRDTHRVYSLVLGTLRDRFLRTDLTTHLRVGPASTAEAEVERVPAPPSPIELGSAPPHAESVKRGLEAFYRRQRGAPADRPDLRLTRGPRPQRRLDLPAPVGTSQNRSPLAQKADLGTGDTESTARGGEELRALQIHNSYLVVESDEGLMVIDQHALHERILYEQLRDRVRNGYLESQRLLVPEPVEVGAAEMELVHERADVLRRLGLELEPFGPRTLLVRSYPAALANLPAAQLVIDLLEKLSGYGGDVEEEHVIDDLLHMIACKAAIKAGQKLTQDEIAELLRRRELARDHHHCPHGRPTALILTREELDQRFGRR